MNTFASPIDRIDRVNASSAVWETTVRAVSSEPGIWERLKGVFSTPVKGVESLINARENFRAFLQQQVRALGHSLSPERRESLKAEGLELMQQILKSSLNPLMESAISRGDGRVDGAGLREAIGHAHAKAELALMQLQSSALRARIAEAAVGDMRPQMIVGADQSIRVIRPAPSIENLVLRGGGAKGVSNPAALTEMETTGMFNGLRKIVGTSVGGLTAISLASGHGIQALSEFTDMLDMVELMGTPKNFEARYPNVDVGCRVGFHSGRALELLDEISAGSVAAYLEKNWGTSSFQEALEALRANGDGASAERLDALRTQDFNADRTSQMITFNDLALLHRLDPAHFKQLVLTGWDLENERMSYFGSENTPDMPIAVAGRISMSLPVLLKSVTYDPGDGLGTRTFVDGGVGSNVSTEVVMNGLQGHDLVEAHARTAVMTFDQNGEAYAVMHGPSRKRSGLADWALSLVTGNPSFGEAAKKDDAKVKDAGPNTFVVFHGDIGTLSLNASADRLQKAKLQSGLKMLEQIEQRQGQAYMVECSSVQACFDMLTEAEKQALREGGAPSPSDYPLRSADLAYRLQSQLYELSLPSSKLWSEPIAVQASHAQEPRILSGHVNQLPALQEELNDLRPENLLVPVSVQLASSERMAASRDDRQGHGLESRASGGTVNLTPVPLGKTYRAKDLMALLETERFALLTRGAVPSQHGHLSEAILPRQLLRASSSVSVEA